MWLAQFLPGKPALPSPAEPRCCEAQGVPGLSTSRPPMLHSPPALRCRALAPWSPSTATTADGSEYPLELSSQRDPQPGTVDMVGSPGADPDLGSQVQS